MGSNDSSAKAKIAEIEVLETQLNVDPFAKIPIE